MILFTRNSLTVTSYENALEQASQITYSILFQKVIKVLLFFFIILGRWKAFILESKQMKINSKHSNQQW